MRLILGLLVLLFACTGSGPTWKIGRDTSWYPDNFYGREANVTGFSDALLGAMKIRAELSSSGPDYLRSGLDQHKWDAIMTTLNPSVEWTGVYRFSKPYLLTGPVVVTRTGAHVQSLADLSDRIVAAEFSSDTITLIMSQNPHINLVTYTDSVAALQDLLADRVDAVVLSRIAAAAYITDIYANQLQISLGPLTDEGLRLVTLEENAELIDTFNDRLEELTVSGKLHELLRQWQLPVAPKTGLLRFL